jgi:hypothetical protein
MDRKNYQLLENRLRKDEIKFAGKVANLLIETFISHNGQLRAAAAYNAGVCKAGEFKRWRNVLITKKWLTYTEGQYSTHTPGSRLIRYLNNETLATKEIATKDDIRELHRELDIMKRAVSMIIEKYDPPATEEKIQAHLKIVKKDVPSK